MLRHISTLFTKQWCFDESSTTQKSNESKDGVVSQVFCTSNCLYDSQADKWNPPYNIWTQTSWCQKQCSSRQNSCKCNSYSDQLYLQIITRQYFSCTITFCMFLSSICSAFWSFLWSELKPLRLSTMGCKALFWCSEASEPKVFFKRSALRACGGVWNTFSAQLFLPQITKRCFRTILSDVRSNNIILWKISRLTKNSITAAKSEQNI